MYKIKIVFHEIASFHLNIFLKVFLNYLIKRIKIS